MAANNLAFRTPEPPDGTWLVVLDHRTLGEGDCPRIIWRDDARGKRYNHYNRTDTRWFKNDACYDPMSWGEVMVNAVEAFEVNREPFAALTKEERR